MFKALQNLYTNNEGGQHNIHGGALTAAGEGSKINIAQGDVNNKHG